MIVKRTFSKKISFGNFIDNCFISVKGGNGGDGGVAFDRSPTCSRGKPSGGNGGRGGSIFFVPDPSMYSLDHIPRRIIGIRGENGGRDMMEGCTGKDKYIKLPLGTRVTEIIDETLFASQEREDCSDSKVARIPPIKCAPLDPFEFTHIGDKPLIVARGGQGGKGNRLFGLNNHEYQKGQFSEQRVIHLDLCKIADVGLVGFPNAGKSSILNAISNAKPRVASFPFTTLKPYIGVVELGLDERFTIADIPGLIEGAHLNRGIGHEFLKHIAKSNILAMVVDISATDCAEQIEILLKELELFSEGLSCKVKLIIANKSDLCKTGQDLANRIDKCKTKFVNSSPCIVPISALYSLATDKLIQTLNKELKTISV